MGESLRIVAIPSARNTKIYVRLYFPNLVVSLFSVVSLESYLLTQPTYCANSGRALHGRREVDKGGNGEDGSRKFLYQLLGTYEKICTRPHCFEESKDPSVKSSKEFLK